MSHVSAVPVWMAMLIALLVVLGATLALIGSIGLLRLRSFYERVHAPTLGTTLGLWVRCSPPCFSSPRWDRDRWCTR